MKLYVRADSNKPVLDRVMTDWEEFEDGSGIKFTILSDPDEVIYEAVFNYDDVDPDAIYDSAVDMAILALSQRYELTDSVIEELKA